MASCSLAAQAGEQGPAPGPVPAPLLLVLKSIEKAAAVAFFAAGRGGPDGDTLLNLSATLRAARSTLAFFVNAPHGHVPPATAALAVRPQESPLMPESNLIRVNFEGRPLVAYPFRGRHAWIAADVGRHLGYASAGKKLIDRMRDDWTDEMIEGDDFDTLTGADLAEFKAICEATPENGVGRASHLTVLYESGLDMVCIKTEKPLGKKLRRLLVKEVMPKLRRQEPILPSAEVVQAFLGRFASLEAALGKTNEATASLQAEVIDLRTRIASGARTSDGLVGRRDAEVYIMGPLNTLASQLADARGCSFRKVLMELDLEVRKAAGHPKAEKGNRWMYLPGNSLGYARRAIFGLQAKHQPELDAHVERVAREAQLSLKTG